MDVEAAFLQKLWLSTSSGRATITGETSLDSFTGTIEGSIEFSSEDLHSTFTLKRARSTVYTLEEIRVAGKYYRKTGAGPWQEVAAPAQEPKTWISFLSSVTSVEQTGVEVRGGRRLYRLVPTGGDFDATAFYSPNADIQSAKVDVSFLAERNGTLAVMFVREAWTTSQGPRNGWRATEFSFSGLGRVVPISRPADVWTLHSSKRFVYSMGYPRDWEISEETDTDVYLSATGQLIIVGREQLSGNESLNRATSELAVDLRREYRVPVEKNQATTVAGTRARLLAFHPSIDGRKRYAVTVVTISNRYVYAFQWLSDAGAEAADLSLMEQFVSTITFP
jgi:hypothetical protein